MPPPDVEGLPWPEGDPAALRRAASRASTSAEQLGAPVPEFTTVTGGDSAWQGLARQRYDGTTQLLGREAGDGRTALRDANTALQSLATTVEREQGVVRELARQLRTAREAAGDAADTARHARTMEALHADGPLPAEERGNPALDLAASQAASHAQAVERRCQAEAEAACTRAETADRNTAATLDGLFPGTSPLLAPGTLPAGLASGSTQGWLDHLGNFLLGDVANFWSGGEDGFPYGSGAMGALRVWRTGQWLRSGMLPEMFPTFNTGLFGRGLGGLGTWASRFRGLGGLSRVAPWLRSPAATTLFRRAGIVGGAFSTVMDVNNLIQQGNPIDAFQRDGAGYVADVARTGFSASTTAFLIAPNPVTGGAVIVTGAVWLGAEVWDNYGDEIADFTGDAWDATTGAVDDAWDATTDFASDTADTVGDALDSAADTAGDVIDDITPW